MERINQETYQYHGHYSSEYQVSSVLPGYMAAFIFGVFRFGIESKFRIFKIVVVCLFL